MIKADFDMYIVKVMFCGDDKVLNADQMYLTPK